MFIYALGALVLGFGVLSSFVSISGVRRFRKWERKMKLITYPTYLVFNDVNQTYSESHALNNNFNTTKNVRKRGLF